jgi:hypothetical protein
VGQEGGNNVNVEQAGSGSGAIDPPLAPEVSEPVWPSIWPTDTDILYAPGSNKVTLMSQHPMLRVVIQDAMELVRANLLFTYAFPDPAVARATIRESLVTSAASYPAASGIHQCLMFDEPYMAALTPLVSLPILKKQILILFIAPRADSAFPQRSQRTMRCYCFKGIFNPQLESNQIGGFETTLTV